MSHREPEPLTPEEREIAQRLARLEASAAPSAGLDARILAAARAGVEAPAARPAAPARRRRPRWPMGMGIAASLVVAVGVAWQLRPQPDSVALDAPSETALSRARAEPAPTAAAADAPVAAAAPTAAQEMTETPADPAAPAAAVPESAAAAGAATASVERERTERAARLARDAATRQVEARQAREVESRQAATRKQATPQPPPARDDAARPVPRAAMAVPPAEGTVKSRQAQLPPPPPPPPPAPPAPPAAAARAPEFVRAPPPPAQSPSPLRARAAPPPGIAAPAPLPTQEPPARAQATPPVLDRIEVTGSRAAPVADVVDVLADQPLDDRPPASADSPAVRERWLQRIRELRDAGQHEAARDSLREFVRRHPQAGVPDDLRPLLEG